MSNEQSNPASDHFDALGDRAATTARAVANRHVGALPDAGHLVEQHRRRRAIRLTALASSALLILGSAAIVHARTRSDSAGVNVAMDGSPRPTSPADRPNRGSSDGSAMAPFTEDDNGSTGTDAPESTSSLIGTTVPTVTGTSRSTPPVQPTLTGSSSVTTAPVGSTQPPPSTPTSPTTQGTTYTTFPPISPVNADAKQCGSFNLAVGWPTTFVPPRHIFDCLAAAFPPGTHATLVISGGATGSWEHPIEPLTRTFYEVTDASTVRVTTDTRVPEGQTPGHTVQVCHGMTRGYPTVDLTDCSSA